MTCHWGIATEGSLGLCGSADGARRTTLRLVNCQYCQNIIDRYLSEMVTFPKDGIPEFKIFEEGST